MTPSEINTRSFIAGCLLLLGYAAICPERIAADDHRTTPPNVIIFLVDDLGAMDIGANNRVQRSRFNP